MVLTAIIVYSLFSLCDPTAIVSMSSITIIVTIIIVQVEQRRTGEKTSGKHDPLKDFRSNTKVSAADYGHGASDRAMEEGAVHEGKEGWTLKTKQITETHSILADTIFTLLLHYSILHCSTIVLIEIVISSFYSVASTRWE